MTEKEKETKALSPEKPAQAPPIKPDPRLIQVITKEYAQRDGERKQEKR